MNIAGPSFDRLEKQKASLMDRINDLEKQLEELIAFTESIAEEPPATSTADLQELMDQEESDLLRVIDGIRDTLKNFEEDSDEGAEEAEASVNAKKTLATIFEQLKTLDMLPRDSKAKAEEAEGATDDADTENAAEESS